MHHSQNVTIICSPIKIDFTCRHKVMRIDVKENIRTKNHAQSFLNERTLEFKRFGKCYYECKVSTAKFTEESEKYIKYI